MHRAWHVAEVGGLSPEALARWEHSWQTGWQAQVRLKSFNASGICEYFGWQGHLVRSAVQKTAVKKACTRLAGR